MSHITNIVLITSIEDGALKDDEHPNADKLSSYLKINHNGCSLVKVDEYAGGSKSIQCDVFMAAINYLNIAAFLNYFHQIVWENPKSVQLMLKNEDDLVFKIYLPMDLDKLISHIQDQTSKVSDLKQDIRKYFILFCSLLILFFASFCGPIWARLPTGIFVFDWLIWSVSIIAILGFPIIWVQQVRRRKFGIDPSKKWRDRSDLLFESCSLPMGAFFVSLPFWVREAQGGWSVTMIFAAIS